jgi:hypothetical protein
MGRVKKAAHAKCREIQCAERVLYADVGSQGQQVGIIHNLNYSKASP